MIYVNKVSGEIITTDSVLGGDWIAGSEYKNGTEVSEMKVADIRSKLDSLGIEYDKGAKKADLLTLLEQHEG